MITITGGINVFLAFSMLIFAILLYFVKPVLPHLSRNRDSILATFAFLYSLIITIHGWRLDPILIFGQFMIITICLFMGWETVRLRGLFDYAIRQLEKEKTTNKQLKQLIKNKQYKKHN